MPSTPVQPDLLPTPPEFYCPSGPGPNSPFKPPFDGSAFWRAMPDGTRTCSYCGSLHPSDFLQIMEAYAAGTPGYKFTLTDKSYKVYANRPGTQNASMGGIKFYGDHAPPPGTPEHDRQATAWQAAVAKYRQSWPQ